jgi:hypothetical protein
MIFSSLLLTSALLAQAQRPSEARAPDNTDRPANSMAEHIEIFRKILGRKLHPVRSAYGYRGGQNLDALTTQYAESGNTLWSHDGLSGTRAWLADGSDAFVEGVYLNGYGVLFTATMPSWSRSGKPSDDKPVAKPLSDWDRAQMELRGEKLTASAPQVAQRVPSLRDSILQVLADNGAHLSRLRDDERLTVVVTFRDHGSQLSTNTLTGSFYNAFGHTATQPTVSGPGPFAPSIGAPLATVPGGAQNRGAPSSARDYELLADLHLKQQEYQTAIEAYAKAIAAYQEEAKSGQSADADVNRGLRALYLRQAQAQLGLGHEDRALDLLQKARSSSVSNSPATTAKEATKESSKPRVPGKLIISATKRQLDQVAQGKMTLEEFRKTATIDEE